MSPLPPVTVHHLDPALKPELLISWGALLRLSLLWHPSTLKTLMNLSSQCVDQVKWHYTPGKMMHRIIMSTKDI